ncbi:hypothetical protein HAX54_003129 [Datura stramonium]|uniref:Uncharacterized protein n=1 Tax=Datura stramonium TaxID=4076 RepID=A0ABS8WRW7_DATST|nr:hypothetical protein [Datura stramonium]
MELLTTVVPYLSVAGNDSQGATSSIFCSFNSSLTISSFLLYKVHKGQTNKNAQDKKARDEIAARRALRDEASAFEQEANSPSGSVEEYGMDTDEIDE